MEERRFVFRLTPYDTELLLPQVRKALEMRTEQLSRQRYPALWAQTDRFRKMSKGRTRSRLRTTVMSMLCLVLGDCSAGSRSDGTRGTFRSAGGGCCCGGIRRDGAVECVPKAPGCL